MKQSFQSFLIFFKKGLPFAVLVIMGSIYFRIATVMIGYIKGPAEVGQYTAAYRLMEGLLFIPAVFSGVILPVISKNIKSNLEQIRVSSHQIIKFLLLLAVPLSFGIVLLSRPIILGLYGAQYTGAIPVLQYLGPTFLALFVSAITSTLINASSRPITNTYIAIVMVILSVSLNSFFIPYFGISGAALATLITETFGLLVGTWYINSYLFPMKYFTFFIKPIIAALIMSVAIIFFPTLYGLPVYIILYFLIIFLLKYLNQEDFRVLKRLFFKH